MAGLPWARMNHYHACTKSQGSNDKISRDEWFICIKDAAEDKTNKWRMERVPSILRKFEVESDRNCYDPLIIAIGPYHHGKPELEAVEMVKILYAKKFLYGSGCGDDQARINQLYEDVAKLVDNASEFYEKCATEKYDKESFSRMMFLDACFVLQFMYNLAKAESNDSSKTDKEPKKEDDQQLTMKSNFTAFVWRDLFLLENQIPLRVVEVLLNLRPEWEKLIQDFLEHAIIMPRDQTSCSNAVKNFFDKCFKGNREKKNQELKFNESPHLLGLMWRRLAGPSTPPGKIESDQWYSHRSVTELEAAGIRFKASKTHHVTEVKFKDYLVYGTMIIPPLMVDDATKSLLLNLVAYETSLDDPSGSPITSYICLMDSLIDHANDVKELRRKGIILNNLGSDDQLATLFNEIADNLVPDPHAYADVKDQIKKHCRNKGQVWIAEWWHNHFSSPWTILAFLAATLVLALTVVQTYFSVFPRSD